MGPVLITGCARSGTSLTAGIFHACGLFMGDTCGPTPSNPKGQFENIAIQNRVIAPYLSSIHADPFGQKPLPRELPPRPWLQLDVSHHLKSQGWQGGLYGIKDSKMALTWKIWAHAFPQAKWVITIRDRDSVMNSCMAAPSMRKITRRREWAQWYAHYERIFTQIRRNCKSVCFVNAAKTSQGDFTSIRNAVKGSGLEWNEEAVSDFVDPSLWHYKGGDV